MVVNATYFDNQATDIMNHFLAKGLFNFINDEGKHVADGGPLRSQPALLINHLVLYLLGVLELVLLVVAIHYLIAAPPIEPKWPADCYVRTPQLPDP